MENFKYLAKGLEIEFIEFEDRFELRREDGKNYKIFKDDSKNCWHSFNLSTIEKIYRNLKSGILKRIEGQKQISIF